MVSSMIVKIVTIVLFVLTVQSGLNRASPIDIYGEFEELMREYIPSENSSEQKPAMTPENLCRMPMRKGVCRALIPRWSYDSRTKECREFKFGGCDGNENNFRSKKQCMKTCKGVQMWSNDSLWSWNCEKLEALMIITFVYIIFYETFYIKYKNY